MSGRRWALLPLLALTCNAELSGGGKDHQACDREVDPSMLMQMDLRRNDVELSPSDALVETPISGPLTLEVFNKGATGCYDRKARSNWAVVDAHLHPRPFGGPPVRFDEMIEWMRGAGILFATLYGIGQRLPVDSPCLYYLDCPGTPLTPSLKNDFFNGQIVLDNNKTLKEDPRGPLFTLSMSFLDLSKPEEVVPTMKLLQGEFPGMFKWVGETNIVKQAIWNNSLGFSPGIETIKKWAPFMKEFRKQDIPLALHCDLGNDSYPTEYLPLMDEALRLYPDNKILWMHMSGLSKQLDPQLPVALLQDPLYIPQHIKIMTDRLEKYPKLTIDLSWDVLYTELYNAPAEKKFYVDMINKYPTRFISGSDFVAAGYKTEEEWRGEVNRTSDIYNNLTDEAFRLVALGENYFKLAGLNYTAPKICTAELAYNPAQASADKVENSPDEAPAEVPVKAFARGWLLSPLLAVGLFCFF